MGDGGFVLAADGWAQVCPLGEFPHAGAGVTQVVDAEACAAMATDFVGRAAEPNFPGVLVDFDHFSMDAGKPSEAAGWVGALEARDDGLWATIRWTDAGLAAVTGGRYRLVSPVFPEPSACEDLGGGRIRPRQLVSVALTNEPNIKGGKPIANRCPEPDGHGQAQTDTDGHGLTQTEKERATPNGMENRGGVKRYRWTLGPEAKGGHCPTCLDRAGQVKTAKEWALMPQTLCGKHCRCTLEEVGTGTKNRWMDEAREASLAVRRAKAAARAAGTVGSSSGSDNGTMQKKTQEQPQEVPAVKKGDTEGSVKTRYTRLLTDLEAAEGDGEKLREASKRYLDTRYRDGTDFTLADIDAVRECLKRDQTLTDYQIRAAEDAITEASAWVRGDSRGLLDVAEEEIAGKLTAAGIRFAEVEALRRVLNPARYFAEYGVEAFPSGLPDWIDDFAASEELQSQYPFLRPGETRQTPTFGPTTYDKALIKQGMMTRKELTESLKRRADAAARQDAVMPILRKTKAGGWTRGSVNVDAAGVMYDLPADMRAGTFGNSGKTMRIPVETRATNVRVIPTRGTRVGAESVAAAVVPLALNALMHSVPAARRSEARNYLRTASEAGKLPEKPGIGAVLSTGARLFFGDIEGAKRGERLWDPIGKNADEKEMAERYGRGSGTKNRWSDAARAASLAVRKAKVATRAVGKVGSGSGGGGGSNNEKTVAGSQKKRGYGMQATTKHGKPQKFLPPTGPATQVLVEWVNVKTGERWTAPSGGYRPPNEDWVPVAGGAAATIRKPGPPAATRVVRGQPPPVMRSPRSVKAPHG
jgi:hypothetical protein